MGPVFRAFDPERDRLVAVKLFRLDLSPDRVHRLVAEFERLIAAELTHPVIAAPIGTGIAGTNAYLAQDYVAAESLDIVVRDRGPASAGEALRAVAQLAGALDFAAVVDIAHGALHPRDVMLSGDEARVTGIGIARALERVGGVVLLRRPYAAPERITGSSWDRRADIFSLAAVIHEMLWGRRIMATCAQTAEALTELPGADLERLRTVFIRALAADPTERYETALEFAAALKDAFLGVSISHQSQVVSRQSVVTSHQSRVASRKSSNTEVEQPLPLDEPERAGLDLRALDLQVGEAERFADVETAPAIVEPTVAASTTDSAPRTPFFAHEKTRSVVWPFMMTLGVGVALGFAGGYGVGVHERSSATAAVAPADPAPADSPAGREFTESTVNEPDTGRSAETTGEGQPRADTTEIVPPAKPAQQVAAPLPPRPSAISATRQVRVPRAAQTTGRLPASSRADVAEPSSRAGIASGSSRATTTGMLTVESKPSRANVFIDNRLIGTTPFLLSEIAAGNHTIRLELDGYRRWSSSVRIVASERHRVTASLER